MTRERALEVITDKLKELRNLPPAYVLVMQNEGVQYA